MAVSDDELEIRSGGVIAVDTDSLRAAAARLTLLADGCDDIRLRLAEAGRLWATLDPWRNVPIGVAVGARDAATALAADLRHMAAAYDLVELWARIGVAEAAGDGELASLLTALSFALTARDPAAALRAHGDLTAWSAGRRSDLLGQFEPAPRHWYDALLHPALTPGEAGALMGATLTGVAGLLIDAVGRGAPGPAPLTGGARPVELHTVASGRGQPPAGLDDVAARIPRGDGRVRVEKYTMRDGSVRFVAYVAGTQMDADAAEPWDMASNLELYRGERSVSYDATMAALEAAGAAPGDTVFLAGHSQGAMVASHVAASGVYTVPALVTLGDPVQVAVGADTLNVDIRHGDDPVSALAAGGHPGGVGSAQSIVVERTNERTLAEGEGFMDPHALTRYVETAALLDASADPRMAPVRRAFDALAGAASVQVTVYGATRTG